jgi:hypothetical protein
MLDIVKPFSSLGYQHREKRFSVNDVRKLRKYAYVLSDIEPFNDLELLSQCDGHVTSIEGWDAEKIRNSAFYVFFSVDDLCLEPIRKITAAAGLYIPPMSFSKTNYSRVAMHVAQTLTESERHVGHLGGGPELHENICQAIDITREIEGDFLEIGVFTGSSAVTAMTHMRNCGIRRKCWLMDTFEGFSYDDATRSADVIWGGTHLVAKENHLEILRDRMCDVGQDYEFVTGNICADPLPAAVKQLALVNIDVDMYEATAAALAKSSPLLQRGGILMCEDPTSTPGLYGAYVAMTEFLESREGKKYTRIFVKTHYFLLKTES